MIAVMLSLVKYSLLFQFMDSVVIFNCPGVSDFIGGESMLSFCTCVSLISTCD